jgi:hypothetical protein
MGSDARTNRVNDARTMRTWKEDLGRAASYFTAIHDLMVYRNSEICL